MGSPLEVFSRGRCGWGGGSSPWRTSRFLAASRVSSAAHAPKSSRCISWLSASGDSFEIRADGMVASRDSILIPAASHGRLPIAHRAARILCQAAKHVSSSDAAGSARVEHRDRKGGPTGRGVEGPPRHTGRLACQAAPPGASTSLRNCSHHRAISGVSLPPSHGIDPHNSPPSPHPHPTLTLGHSSGQ